MPGLGDIGSDGILQTAMLVIIVAGLVSSILLLITARLPLLAAVAAATWMVLYLAVASWARRDDLQIGPGTGRFDLAAYAISIAAVALLVAYIWLWRTGGLLTHVVRRDDRPGRPSAPVASDSARLPSRNDADPDRAPGRHQPDLRSARANLDRGEYRSAVRDAGPVLEDVIDSWLKRDLGYRDVPEEMSMHERINRVAAHGHLTAQQRAQVGRWWGIRNRASHELGPIAQMDAREMVDGVTRLAGRLAKK